MFHAICLQRTVLQIPASQARRFGFIPKGRQLEPRGSERLSSASRAQTKKSWKTATWTSYSRRSCAPCWWEWESLCKGFGDFGGRYFKPGDLEGASCAAQQSVFAPCNGLYSCRTKFLKGSKFLKMLPHVATLQCFSFLQGNCTMERSPRRMRDVGPWATCGPVSLPGRVAEVPGH